MSLNQLTFPPGIEKQGRNQVEGQADAPTRALGHTYAETYSDSRATQETCL